MMATHAPLRSASLPREPAGQPIQWTRLRVVAAACSVIALTFVIVAVLGRGGGMSGLYADADGRGSLEFRGSKVYITTVLGTTFVSTYEVDGKRVIIKGAGGSQVFTRDGATLDGGLGMKFIKK